MSGDFGLTTVVIFEHFWKIYLEEFLKKNRENLEDFWMFFNKNSFLFISIFQILISVGGIFISVNFLSLLKVNLSHRLFH